MSIDDTSRQSEQEKTTQKITFQDCKVGPPFTSPWLGKLHPQPHLCFIQAAASSKQRRAAAISSLVHSIPSKEPGMQQKSSAWYTPSYNFKALSFATASA
mmetsp:Transcript_24885/g.40452  ORF Transcript_24885/g.40452 Transcript_24885/m.40452 type:complete len:100 (-) Transcript_24885:32-331(-)